jgi:hypothetical protein
MIGRYTQTGVLGANLTGVSHRFFDCWSYFLLITTVAIAFASFNSAQVTADVQLKSVVSIQILLWVPVKFDSVLFQNDGVHSVYWPRLRTLGEKLFASDSARYDVADEWVALWQVSCKVHFFPANIS